MKDKTIKIIFISFITMAILCVMGLSYAYFSLEVEGEGKDIVMNTGDLRLEYKDETPLSLTDAMPGDSVTKVITVTNLGTKNVTYSLYWGDLINTIENYELHVTLDCKSYINYRGSSKTESGTCNNIYRAVPISSTKTSGYIKKGISIDPGVTQEYTVTILFDNKNYPQNDNLNKKFTGKIGIEEYQAPEAVYCTFDGDMVQGSEYVNGQYTYRYKQHGYIIQNNPVALVWTNMDTDGWGVQLTDKASTDAVNSKLCTYINDKPVVSMTYMFSNSQATSIDVSNFNTSNVTNMSSMFRSSKATTLDVSNFDTSNLTNMNGMFFNSQATTLDVSNFDTSKVTDMGRMFSYSQATTLDLSNFDTSKVTDMMQMFLYSQATTLDLSNFNTSNVTNMSSMFRGSQATTLDLSVFDTSNVTDMSYMFYNSTKLKIIYASNKFNTDLVTSSSNMFTNCTSLVGGSGTKFDSTKIDKTYARIDGGTSNPGYFTSK